MVDNVRVQTVVYGVLDGEATERRTRSVVYARVVCGRMSSSMVVHRSNMNVSDEPTSEVRAERYC